MFPVLSLSLSHFTYYRGYWNRQHVQWLLFTLSFLFFKEIVLLWKIFLKFSFCYILDIADCSRISDERPFTCFYFLVGSTTFTPSHRWRLGKVVHQGVFMRSAGVTAGKKDAQIKRKFAFIWAQLVSYITQFIHLP